MPSMPFYWILSAFHWLFVNKLLLIYLTSISSFIQPLNWIMKSLCLLLLAFSGLSIIWAQLQCRDESGKAVNWYVVYKFPKIKNGEKPLDTGYRYAFITSNDNNGWTLSEYGVNDSKNSIFGQTLAPIYSTKLSSSISYLEYNDEPPEGETKGDGAHAKGVLASDESIGFWLIHSVPHFASDQVCNHTLQNVLCNRIQ